MSVLTKQRGLKAIERAGGVDAATFALKEGYPYPIARGHRIAETNRQLDDGPLTGAELFADLESRNWLLPDSGRRYRPGEFRAHLKYMVKNGRLHVLTGADLDSPAPNGVAIRRELGDPRDGNRSAHTSGGDKKARNIRPTNQNLESGRATKPLTAWLIHAAKSRRTMTYGKAKRLLESDCGFDVVFTVAVGRVAGAAMNRILEAVPDAPLLNVLLVQGR